MGGRFFGPWWQSCPKDWRREIFINDAPTIEEDYSSLHIALLYSRRGHNYYSEFKGDAYQIETPDYITSAEQARKYAKLLMLIAVNAKDDADAFAAFRSNRRDRGDRVGASLTNKQLSQVLEALRKKHPIIADDLGSDAGIELMYQDSKITERVIEKFTDIKIPILTVHDSYIVNFAYSNLLHSTLTEAYEELTGQQGIRSERTGVAMDDESSWLEHRLTPDKLERSEGYKERLLEWMLFSE